MMVDGRWDAADGGTTTDATGDWQRRRSVLRNWITADGAPGRAGEGGFAAEPGRYHLYVAINCPWAHRALLTRVIKRLEGLIDISVALPKRSTEGWVFGDEAPFRDGLFGASALHEIYARGGDSYTGRVTVPVLWDKGSARIVSNESADIVTMLNAAFAGIAPKSADLRPVRLSDQIDAWNSRIYEAFNNGVYRAGFASSQAAYETAARGVFEAMDALEARLGQSPFIAGDVITEADVRLFPTLARFDVAYNTAFRCNLRRLQDYPRLWLFARRFYHMTGVAETVDFDIYKRGYFSVSEKRNSLGIVHIGPLVDWSLPAGVTPFEAGAGADIA